MQTYLRTSLLGFAVLLASAPAWSDALIVTRAMLATTIAEYSIEEGRLVLELEIGAADLEAFRNLLPDEAYARLGHAPESAIERLARFFERDLVLAAGEGPPLVGSVREIALRPRLKRDETSSPSSTSIVASYVPLLMGRGEIRFTVPDSLTSGYAVDTTFPGTPTVRYRRLFSGSSTLTDIAWVCTTLMKT